MASEVLKLATFRGDANSVQALLTVASGKTATVLSVTICETAGALINPELSRVFCPTMPLINTPIMFVINS